MTSDFGFRPAHQACRAVRAACSPRAGKLPHAARRARPRRLSRLGRHSGFRFPASGFKFPASSQSPVPGPWCRRSYTLGKTRFCQIGANLAPFATHFRPDPRVFRQKRRVFREKTGTVPLPILPNRPWRGQKPCWGPEWPPGAQSCAIFRRGRLHLSARRKCGTRGCKGGRQGLDWGPRTLAAASGLRLRACLPQADEYARLENRVGRRSAAIRRRPSEGRLSHVRPSYPHGL